MYCIIYEGICYTGIQNKSKLLVVSSTDGILQLLEKVPAGPLALARPHQQRLERVRGGAAAEGAELGRVRVLRQALG